VVFDRGYPTTTGGLELTRSHVDFVTRLKDNALYGVVKSVLCRRASDVLRDRMILLTSQEQVGPRPDCGASRFGWKRTGDPGLCHQQPASGARTIARIYKERWQIELSSRPSSRLKVKTFVGTSENAVQIQIWTALIAMLVLKYLQLKSIRLEPV